MFDPNQSPDRFIDVDAIERERAAAGPPCGCPTDEYHLADCPHRTGGYGPATKDEWLDIMSDPDYDDDHPDQW